MQTSTTRITASPGHGGAQAIAAERIAGEERDAEIADRRLAGWRRRQAASPAVAA